MSQVEYGPLAAYYELCNESFVDYDGQASLVRDAWARFGGTRCPRVLDVACGAGLLSKRLLALGLDVVGIDLAAALVAQAAARPGARVVQADMRRLPFDRAFHVAACLLHTMNYMTEDADLHAAFAAIHHALKSGGLAIVDFLAYEPRREWNAQWSQTVVGHDVRIVCEHHQTADWRAMVATDQHTYTVHERDRVWSASAIDRLRITSPTEMGTFAEEAGLEVLTIAGKYALDQGLGWDGGVLIARRRA